VSDNEKMTFDVNQHSRKDVTVFTSGYDEVNSKFINIGINHEGFIMDFYENAEFVGTIGMTYDEWFEFSGRTL
jgi:hypothetical protein